jgi:replication factor C large subunit
VLKSEGAKLGPGDRISIVNNSGGDIRSMLNSAQSRAAGYATASNKDVVDVDIADAINGYFSTTDMPQAMQLLSKADASYSDPRYEGMTAEARRKDMIAALFSSIVSSHVGHDDLAAMLDVLSRADMMVGRAGRMRQWRLLRHVTRMIASGLYERSRQKGIKYSQYAMPWPVMGPIFAKSQSTRKIMAELAPAVHVSKSACGSFVLPYFIQIMIDSKVDPVEFAVDNFNDESVGESLAKVMEKARK